MKVNSRTYLGSVIKENYAAVVGVATSAAESAAAAAESDEGGILAAAAAPVCR